MEKLTCTSCGATMTPNTNQPYLVCEYCDSAMENKYYVAPVEPVAAASQAAAVQEEIATEVETSQATETQEEEPTLIEKLVDAGKDLLTGALTGNLTQGKQNTIYTTYTQPVTYAQPVTYVQPRPAKPAARPVQPARPARPTGKPSQHSRPVKPAIQNSGRDGMHQRPEGGRPSGNHGHGGGRGPGGGHGKGRP